MNYLARSLFPDKAILFDKGLCTECERPVNPDTTFTDAASRKEYTISGMCQSCQDKFFDSSSTNCEHVCTGNCRREGCNCTCGEFHNK